MNYAVIMAGGSGQRLWPLSRKTKPKQIINLFEDRSLLQNCVRRIGTTFQPEQILVVTNAEYADIVRKHLPEIPGENILGEPVGRDTANAVGLAATVLQKRDVDPIMAVFPADHIIEPVEPLQEALNKALVYLEAHPESLFTFGIKATFAHTGYGYLKRGDKKLEDGIYPVEAFKEKPNKSTAGQYIRSGQYCWNSGMFAWRVNHILKLLEEFLPHNADRLSRIGKAWDTEKHEEMLEEEFRQLEKISIDFGVMEKADNVVMCELDCHWVDVGSYQVLATTIGAIDDDENVTTANTLTRWMDSRNNIAISETPDHLIAAIGVEDMIVVHTDDITLICRREDTDSLKDLLAEMHGTELERFI